MLALCFGAVGCATTSPDRYQLDDGARTSTYAPAGGAGGAVDLLDAAKACHQRLGIAPNGPDTGAAYKQCMLQLGWRYTATTRQAPYPDPNPDEAGMVCRDFVIFGVVGSSCHN
jgi:ferredoxin